ncbi:LPS export ABC transporter permease LptG [candidate division KSB1 bacterium]|nr:LPS export ABC transporter permease LptG [candidate division KSB1 bacterium]
MTILDRYLSRSFLSILLFAFFAFICIFIVVDGIEKLDVYIAQQVPKMVVAKLYLYYIPYIIILTLPVAMLLSSLFSVGNLARYNEITAMKASGLSLYRILAPIFVIAFLISIGAMLFAEYVVPPANAARSELMAQYSERRRQAWRRKLSNVYALDDQGRRINIRSYDSENKSADKVTIRKFDGLSLSLHVYAEKMIWENDNWILYDGIERTFEAEEEQVVKFTRKPFPNTGLKPEDLAKIIKKPEEMSYTELKAFIKEVERNGGDPNHWMVDLYLKIAVPFANFIIVLFGAPLSSQKRRGGTATGFGLSLTIVFIYFGIIKTAQSMGQNGMLPPLLAAWIANIIFLIASFFILLKAHK